LIALRTTRRCAGLLHNGSVVKTDFEWESVNGSAGVLERGLSVLT
jgi:hypothetical protein